MLPLSRSSSRIGIGISAAPILLLLVIFRYTSTQLVVMAAPVNVRILSQNVQFIDFANTVGNRGYGISAAILGMRPQYDVIVLQEVFVGHGREDLLKWLTPQYPHVLQQQKQHSDLDDKNFSFSIYDSGLLVLSKFPIRSSWYTKYSQSSGLDYLSDKGAVVALIDVPDGGTSNSNNNTSAPLLLAGTHMQAGGSRTIVKSQVDEMGRLLSQAYDEVVEDANANASASSIPLTVVACGDFNIRHTRKGLYKYLLAGLSNDTVDTFDAMNPTLVEEGTTPGSKHRIDYVFHLHQLGSGSGNDDSGSYNNRTTLVEAGIDHFAPNTGIEGHAALSDHYGAWASFDFNSLVAGPPGPPPLEIPPMPTMPPTTTPTSNHNDNIDASVGRSRSGGSTTAIVLGAAIAAVTWIMFIL